MSTIFGIYSSSWLFISLLSREQDGLVSTAKDPTAAPFAEGELDTGAQVATLLETSHPPPSNATASVNDPPLSVQIAQVNQHSHLDKVVRIASVHVL